MLINGSEYNFKKKFTLAMLQEIFQYEQSSGLGSVNLFEMLAEGKLEDFKPKWAGYCKLLFTNADDGLSVENLGLDDIQAIRNAFQEAVVGIPKKSTAA